MSCHLPTEGVSSPTEATSCQTLCGRKWESLAMATTGAYVHCCPVSLCWNDAETMHDRCIIYEDHLDGQLTTTGAQSAI